MTYEKVMAVHETVRASFTGEMTFPQIVQRLAAIGIERYHADYTRREKTYYFSDGTSLTAALPMDGAPAEEFSAVAVESAIRQSQRNEHTYADFLRKTVAAGCVGYFVQISGRRALYFGRNGEVHVEPFPAPPAL